MTPADAETWIAFFEKHWYFFVMVALVVTTVRQMWRGWR